MKLMQYRPARFSSGPKRAKLLESTVKDRVRAAFSPYFRIEEEVTGQHPRSGRVRADFLCFPLDAMIGRGWPAEWFVIETKPANMEHRRRRQASQLARQARIYRESSFTRNGETMRPAFALMCPPIREIIDNVEEMEDCCKEHFAWAISKVASWDDVWELSIAVDTSFQIRAHGIHPVFDSRYGSWDSSAIGNENLHASRS